MAHKYLIFLAILMVGITSAASSPPNGKAFPKVIVAVDKVTAWPNLVSMRDGTIIATIFNRPSHGQVEGDIECWASTDGGLTWKLRGTPTKHDPGTNRMNVAVGLGRNGDLIVIVSGWSDRAVAGQVRISSSPFRAGICHPWICRSYDGGKSWLVDKRSFPLVAPDGGLNIPFGNIYAGSQGDLIAATYSVKKTTGRLQGDRVFMYRSGDDGKTWGSPLPLDPTCDCNETAPFYLGGSRWLAAARVNGGGLQLYYSGDDARTWKHRAQLTTGSRYPANIIRLKDRRILLTYGNRMSNEGIDVMLSPDDGRNWSPPYRLCDFSGDGGYPASVQRSDGMVVTAYYAAASPGHKRYHMGVVIWDPSKLSELKPSSAK